MKTLEDIIWADSPAAILLIRKMNKFYKHTATDGTYKQYAFSVQINATLLSKMCADVETQLNALNSKKQMTCKEIRTYKKLHALLAQIKTYGK